jgi:hypothetical protein
VRVRVRVRSVLCMLTDDCDDCVSHRVGEPTPVDWTLEREAPEMNPSTRSIMDWRSCFTCQPCFRFLPRIHSSWVGGGGVVVVVVVVVDVVVVSVILSICCK